MNLTKCINRNLLMIKNNQFLIYKNFTSKDDHIKGDFKNSILISKSNSIFENLAIEDWLYRYQDFNDNHLLLIWYDRPSIVIGRHQNPWQEVNLKECLKSNIDIARRNSGGGTVYHDLNNLNICFFTNKLKYNRKKNLEFIKNTIKLDFKIDLNINIKEDLVFDRTEEKVSGTASKLAFNKSYHHCTLLIDSNLTELSKYIRKRSDHIISNATKSVYSPVKNLSSINPNIQIDNVIQSLVNNYKLINKINDVYYVDFNEQLFPNINKLKADISDWNWVYGKTPKFKIVKTDFINQEEYRCELNIIKGLINEINLFKQNKQLNDNHLLDVLIGCKLILNDCKSRLDNWLESRTDFESIYLSKLILDTINVIS